MENYWKFLNYRDNLSITKYRKPITRPKAYIADILKNESGILDLGAGDRRLLKHLKEKKFSGDYRSCDIDVETYQDYYNIDEVTGRYSAITLIEILEHIPLSNAIPLLGRAIKRLESNGTIIITVPNVYCPGALEQTDITHVQHWPVRDLCAILIMLGFRNRFELYKVYSQSFYGVSPIREVINKILRKLICFDYCNGIILRANKN